MLAVSVDPRHIQRIALDFGRQRDGVDTGHKAQIARHADAELGLAFRYGLCNLGTGWFQPDLCLYFLRNTQAFQQADCVEAGAAATCGIANGDRLCRQQRALERIRGAEVGLGSALLYKNGEADLGDFYAAPRE